MNSKFEELELLERMASFHARPVEDGRTISLISSLFQTLGARSEIAAQLIKSIPGTENQKQFADLLKYHNDLIKHILALP